MKHIRTDLADFDIRFMAFMKEVRSVEGIINFTYGEPFQNTPDSIKQAALEALNENRTKYPLPLGLPELKQAILKRYQERYGVSYSEQEIVITTGASQSLADTLLALVEPGDEVIGLEPCFILYEPMVTIAHGTYVGVDTSKDGFQIVKETIVASVTSKTKAIILTSPNNPTGISFTAASLQALAEIALEYGIFLICDDIYDQIVFHPIASLVEYPEIRDHLIILQSFSKSYSMTGWRLGYAIAPEKVMKAIGNVQLVMQSGVSTFIQYAGLEALNYDNTSFVDDYRRNADAIALMLAYIGLPFHKPDGAFYVYPDVSEFGLSSWDFCLRALHDYKVALIPGSCFSSHNDRFFRISFVCSPEELKEGMHRLSHFVDDLRKERSL